MRRRLVLTAGDARALMQAARTEAERRALEVAIAIVDEAGVLLALERLDGARLHTPEAATMKARTAAIVRTSTFELQKAVASDPALLSFPDRMPLTGGAPLIRDGTTIRGVGSSGGEPEEDTAVCEAALEALGHLPSPP